MKRIALLFGLLISVSVNAQSVLGKWQAITDDSGKAKSHVEIYKSGDKYFGKIITITNPKKQDVVCSACTGADKGKKILGLILINNLVQDGDEFSGGTILDPNNGKLYDCMIWVDEIGNLQVRGYIGWFFKTQTWIRL